MDPGPAPEQASAPRARRRKLTAIGAVRLADALVDELFAA